MTTYARLAVLIAALTACGDDAQVFVDARAQDAAAGDGSVGDGAAGTDSATDTDGSTVPDGSVPDGSVPDGAVLDGGVVPDGPVPDGPVPDGPVPDGGTSLDGGMLPDAGAVPDAAAQSAMWRGAERIESLGGFARTPLVGMDGAGRALVVWQSDLPHGENEGVFRGEIYANRYDPAIGWGTPTLLSLPATPATFGAHSADAAINDMGEAMAVWQQHDGEGGVDIVARRFTSAGGWQPVAVLHDGTAGGPELGRPHVAVAADGTAIAMWSQRAGLDMQLHARRFVPSSGWAAAMPVHAPAMGDARGADLGMDASGRAVAVWIVRAGGGTLWGSRFTAPVGWSAPVRLDAAAAAAGAADAEAAELAVDPAGNAVVVLQSRGETSSVWAIIGTAGGAWQPATRLEDADRYANAPDVAVDALGNAIAVWQSWPVNELAIPDIRARRFAPGSGWGAIEPVEATAAGGESPDVASSASGATTVVWRQGGAGNWARRRTPAGEWSAAERIDAMPAGATSPPLVAAAGDRAVAVWPHDPMPVDNHPTPSDLWANVRR